MKKRMMSVFIALVFVFTSVINVSAAETLKGVAFGDSIAAYFGLKESQGFVSLLSGMLKEQGIDNSFINRAVSGYNSGQLIEQLNKADERAYLKDADAVLISIGGNNIMQPCIMLLAQDVISQGIDNISKITTETVQYIITRALTDEETAVLEENIGRFDKDLPVIVEKIREQSPEAVIVFYTVYNPLPKELGIYDGIENLLTKLNKIITDGAKTHGYLVVDNHKLFAEAGASVHNFDLFKGSVDIHPSAEGHKVIAQGTREALQPVVTALGAAARNTEALEPAEEPAGEEPIKNPITGMKRSEVLLTLAASLNDDFVRSMAEHYEIYLDEIEPFEDVQPGHPAYVSATAAKHLGIVRGGGNNRFNPDDVMLRQDLVTLINAFLTGYIDSNYGKAPTEINAPEINDKSEISGYANESVENAVRLGVVSLDSKGNFNPKDGVTQEFIMEIMSNISKAKTTLRPTRLLSKSLKAGDAFKS